MEPSVILFLNPNVQSVTKYCQFYLLNNPSFLLLLPYFRHTLIAAHIIVTASKADHLAFSFLCVTLPPEFLL